MIVPPVKYVRLIATRDHLELAAVYAYREIVGLGRIPANKLPPRPDAGMFSWFFELIANTQIWVVVVWRRYEDGQEETRTVEYFDPETSEAEARGALDARSNWLNRSKLDLLGLCECFEAKEDDLAYIANRFPDIPDGPPDPKSIDEYDLYQARLKVLAGLQPRTVALMEQAFATEDPRKREKIEKEAVQAYFAELAHYWTEDLVLQWQRSNPVGTEWLCEFARTFQEPKRELDPVNHELALNWLRRKYQLLSAEELSDAILIATGQRLTPTAIKKRRERLGLTTKRPPGPPPKGCQ